VYADNTLTPKEATRLCALGTLAQGPVSYAALAESVRHFISHVMGPSLDVMAPAIELLKYEGLVTTEGDADAADLSITEAGRTEFVTLMTADLRASGAELNRLIVALKFRFLHLLDTTQQRDQAAILAGATENELARLDELRRHHANDTGHLVGWLDREITSLEERLAWLEGFAGRL